MDTIQSAWNSGVRYFDTAPFYGHGLSERLVGDSLREFDDRIISTKVGRLLKPGRMKDPGAWVTALPFEPVFDYSYDGIMRSYEDSLQRLGLDRIDILYIHDIGDLTHGKKSGAELFEVAMNSGYRALEQLRMAGDIKAVGLGVNESKVCEQALDRGDWDVFMLAGRYTLLEQQPLHDLFPACEASGTSIVIGGPFNSGVLVGYNKFDYTDIPESVINKTQKLEAVVREYGIALPAVAIQFPAAHKIVKSVVPGPRSGHEYEQILEWWNADIPDSLWTDLVSEELIDPLSPTPAGIKQP